MIDYSKLFNIADMAQAIIELNKRVAELEACIEALNNKNILIKINDKGEIEPWTK